MRHRENMEALNEENVRLLSLLRRTTVEILTEEELASLIKSGDITAYIGYEPSNVLHIGSLVACSPLLLLAKHGFRGKILLADVHAWLNGKGELEELRELAVENERILRRVINAFGVPASRIEFVYGSDYQFSVDYVRSLLKLSRLITASKARKAMDMISRREMAHKVSSEIYSLMQCLDIMFLGANVAIGGKDQRRIHVLAREYLTRLDYIKPVAIHTPIILGIDGKEKMSKSLNNAIFLNDPPEQIEYKVRMAYCPEGVLEANMVFDILQYLILVWMGKIEINGIPFDDASTIFRYWVNKRISAKELKKSVSEALIQLLKKIQG